MSYPGRPPLVQGIPPMAYMPMSGPPPPLMPTVMPLQHMVPMQVTSAPQIRAFPKLNPNREQLRQLQLQGPAVTVFVGNIAERAPDTMIRQILSACGPVISWKRVKGFGFCELAGPDAGLRAVRILHDLVVGEKNLVAKVDAKTKAILDEYKAEKRKKDKGSSSPLQDELEEEEPLDEESQMLDSQAIERIKLLLVEYEEEMNNFEMKKEEEQLEKRNKILDEADVEEEKRDLITREIGKFREIMKKQEEEREVSRKKEKDRHGERGRTVERSSSHSPSPKRRPEREEKKKRHTRSRSKEKIVERERDRDRSERRTEHETDRARDRDTRESREAARELRETRERDRDRERERENRERERENRDRDRERERDRDDNKSSKSAKDLQKEKEVEEETKEKKRIERRTREKEASYQDRLRGWENRERKKSKEYEKEREKDRQREEDRERDAKRLKEFLEDYDDERDDVKFYKGRELQKRLAERVKEAESDGRDRIKEKEEIEELKNKIFSGEYEDPSAEFEKIKKQREEQYKPKLLIDVNMEHWKQREKDKGREQERERQRDRDREQERQRQREEREKFVVQQAAQELAAVEAEPIDSDSDMDNDHFSPKIPPPEKSNDASALTPQPPDEDSPRSITANHDEEAINPTPHPTMKLTLSKPIVFSPHGQTRDPKRKKLDLREVFNQDEDDTSTQVKKRKLVPLDYNEDKKSSKKDKENGEKKSEGSIKSQEEKRKHIKSLIEKIPTEKEALFAYQLDWSVIDNGLMEKKIRPWINKKIIEYIGEPEPTLVDFICSKVMAGSQPQIILEDVQMVLDEEAEVFVVKMWRLLIYEVEAKKLGIS